MSVKERELEREGGLRVRVKEGERLWGEGTGEGERLRMRVRED